MNPLLALQDYGQSVWLDYMQRHLITSGELQRLIDEDGLRGMTSNPAIFEKAITGSTDYTSDLQGLRQEGKDAVATYEHLAIQELIGEGININVTLLFAQETYERVAEAYIAGLEALAARGGEVAKSASVASFFISRIDTAVDAALNARLQTASSAKEQALLRSLMGQVAIANAKLTYQRYLELFRGPRWQALADQGAQTQRLLWASTSTKNPQYRDVLYVEE